MSPGADRALRGDRLTLRAGDWVEVRSAEEILATLDEDGGIDALPFMPEMLQFCGKRFEVFKSAHKGCDTIGNWSQIRLMNDAVHLRGLRCDGGAHGGCQARCLLYWKTAWLKPVPGPTANEAPRGTVTAAPPAAGGAPPRCDMNGLHRATRAAEAPGAEGEERYRCQATDLVRATVAGRWWHPRQYFQDLASGNVKLWDFIRYGLYAGFNSWRPYPYIRGLAGAKTPGGETLGLQPGDWVRVRSKDEILRTLNHKLRHRGLFFDIEMLPFCGRTFRILSRVDRLIDERNGVMRFPRRACFILEGVACGGCLSRSRMFCPRSIYPYWHEAWLERAGVAGDASGAGATSPRSTP